MMMFSSTVARSWEIKVTQIDCCNPARPDDSGCFQYHTGLTGRVKTFNFDNCPGQSHLPAQE